MSRVPPLDRDNAPPEAQVFFDKDLETYGQVLNTTGVSAYRPSIASAARRLSQAVAEAGLVPEQLRLLINLRVASLVGCPF
jgi:hypothetical protein